MKTFQPWTIDGNTLQLTRWPDHEPGTVLVDVDVFEELYGPVLNTGHGKLYSAVDGETAVLRDLFRHIDTHPQTHYTLRTRHPERVREAWPERCGTDCECECHEVPPPNRHIPCQAGGCWERPNVTLQIGPIHTQAEADRLLPAGLECSDLVGSVEVYCQPTERIQFPLPCRESVFRAAVSRIVVSGGDQPMHPDWVRCIRDQCLPASVPFAFLGWGDYVPLEETGHLPKDVEYTWRNIGQGRGGADRSLAKVCMVRVGRERSGNTLDGRTWPRTEVG